jgi:hypothetical protein
MRFAAGRRLGLRQTEGLTASKQPERYVPFQRNRLTKIIKYTIKKYEI